ARDDGDLPTQCTHRRPFYKGVSGIVAAARQPFNGGSMPRRDRWAPSLSVLLLGALLAGCAPATAPASTSSSQPATPPSRTLVMVTRAEPSTLSGTLLLSLGIGATANRRPFNAALAILDGNLEPRPYLA